MEYYGRNIRQIEFFTQMDFIIYLSCEQGYGLG